MATFHTVHIVYIRSVCYFYHKNNMRCYREWPEKYVSGSASSSLLQEEEGGSLPGMPLLNFFPAELRSFLILPNFESVTASVLHGFSGRRVARPTCATRTASVAHTMSTTRIAHPALYPHHHWPRFLFNHTVCHVVIYRLKYELHAIEMEDNYRAVSEVSAAVETYFGAEKLEVELDWGDGVSSSSTRRATPVPVLMREKLSAWHTCTFILICSFCPGAATRLACVDGFRPGPTLWEGAECDQDGTLIKAPTWRAGREGLVVVTAVLGVARAWLDRVSCAHGRVRGASPAHLHLLATSFRLFRLGTLAIRGLEPSPCFGLTSPCRRPEPFPKTRRSLGGGQLIWNICRGPASVDSTLKRFQKDCGIGIRPFNGWAGGIYRFRAVFWRLEHVGLRRSFALRA